MIIQCDQCKTKFRLDDARVPDKGVKVRCARCKNVFLVRKEAPAEEQDLDLLLSGLGTGPAAAVAAADSKEDTSPVDAAGKEPLVEETPAAPEPVAVEAPVETAEKHAGRDDFAEDFFSFGAEPSVPEGQVADEGEYNFGEVSLESPDAAATIEETAAFGEKTSFGEYSFDEDVKEKEPAPAEDLAETAATAGEYDFGMTEPAMEESSQSQEKVTAPDESGDDFVFSSTPLPAVEEKEEDLPVFEEKSAQESQAVSSPAEAKIEEPLPNSDFFEPATAAAEPPATADAAKQPEAKIPATPFAAPSSPSEEELPPLSIASRKKTSSTFPVMVTSIAVIVVVAIMGFGLYLFKEGPSAFDKLGLSFLAKWIGMESSAKGNITIKNPHGAFIVNKNAGEIFVVSGEAVNNFREPRASIQVKASVLGPKGEVILQKTAYCGNTLSNDQLATLPMDKMEEAMASPFGDTLANLGVPSGKSIPFVVVFDKVPKDAGEFSVEVIGSTASEL